MTMKDASFLNLSTPSLGITANAIELMNHLNAVAFNSLSRDHYEAPEEAVVMTTSSLSTPSLGITEPDSGIFRLSAAFCRGTSSHK